MNVEFRLAKLEDVEEIIKLCNEVFEEETDLDFAKNMFEKSELDENQIYLVGTMNNKIVAHAKITIIPTMYKDMNTYCILNHVCVKPEYRRHNIATKMIEECEKISKEHNCSSMKLWSNNYRGPAHACYKKYGFEVNDASFFSKNI